MRKEWEIVIDHGPDNSKFFARKDFNIVAVDVLRATSTIIVAISQGADEVIPTVEVDEARRYRHSHGALLVGERQGQIIEGFDYTNSPLDLSVVDLSGKIVALTTSDGTRLVAEAADASYILIASTLNYSYVAEAILAIGGNWAVLGAGSKGEFRPEDKVGCALVVKEISDKGIFFMDKTTKDLIDEYSQNWPSHINGSLSTQKLEKIGRRGDVDYVINTANKFNLVPRARRVEQRMSIKKLSKK